MGTLHVRLPDQQKKQIEQTAKTGNYGSPSEWVREAIREKLDRETSLHPEEVKRILEVWQNEADGTLETIPAEQVWEAYEGGE